MPTGPDTYSSMTALYDDPRNIEGTTYAKRWKRHEWSQTIEEQPTDNAEIQAIVMAVHGGGIEKGYKTCRRLITEMKSMTFEWCD